MLTVKKLNVYHGYIHAVKNISFEIKRGEIFSLIGANGAGKSSLLSAISGIKIPDSGEIYFDDMPIQNLGIRKMVNKGIVLVPEGREIFYDMTVKENLLLGAYRHNKKINLVEELERVYSLFPGLKKMEKRIAGTLSGGEQQMVAIGRGLMAKPSLLLLDEPSLGLAPLIIKEIFEQLKTLKNSGVTIILVEQNAKAALNISDHAAVLVRGEIVAIEKAEKLLQDSHLHEMYVGTSLTN
ncbi:ABC transporter ATP-binding protein [Neobacillus sp. NPDC097160]|uniref:ABC transporter ATP-binding protein n=1 Tax=Neobacillus sp. NPDC097160 TaxID=3364298 RepID=UPI0038114617